ncbi:DUF817 domain-containing protein [Paenibacillus sp. N3/727]|uniref:DUF817 domain-containing protein n=1 Tax=Paenibacillus sp. N3/727 TaxID=2925845 RepID=UPI001F53C464|nr:DUF817 domain-containing protein [Paenibacillus sp. N3/727]UNK19055.1 DUF817 domain-containing protein [Paenibacillus sp. N3/727]
MTFIRKLWAFGIQQALSCIFPVIIFAALGVTKMVEVPGIHRYDLILIICLLAQVGMVAAKLETFDELKVICVFHVIGLMLELYKVHMGSWSYPEEGWSKIGGVPLYSGFMYASVASYICQAWRRMNLRITGWPLPILTVLISAAIYANFFTHHFVWDARWLLTLLLFLVFLKTVVHFDVLGKTYRMPLTLSFLLIGFFIWIAENISTFLGAWTYPGQEKVWSLVHIGKISSWFLLVVISLIIVAQLKHLKLGKRPAKDAPKGTVM